MNVLASRSFQTPLNPTAFFTVSGVNNLNQDIIGQSDAFTPSPSDEWTPPSRALLAQVVGRKDALQEVGNLVRKTGRGGTLQKQDLQSVSPEIFGLPQNIERIPTVPNIASSLKDDYVGNLLYSNNPERITKPNVLLSEADVAGGTTRILAHHLNATNETLRLATTFRNEGNKPVQVTLQKFASSSKHEGSAADAGLQTYKDYLKDERAQRHEIPPGGAWVLNQGTMTVEKNAKGSTTRDQVASSLALISADGPLKATTTATSLDFDPAKDRLETAALETSKEVPSKPPLKFRGAGDYPHPDLHQLGVIPMGQGKPYQFEIGPKTTTGGSTFDGEYGQERRYTFVVGNDAKPGQRLSILAWAGGSDPVGIRAVGETEKVMRLVGKPGHRDQVGVVFEGEVKAGQVIDFSQMMQAGAATPVRFILIPTPAPGKSPF